VDIVFHYPPDLMALLIDTIPRLCKGKKDVFLFFKGAGLEAHYTADLEARFSADKDSVGKWEIARTVLTRLNERGEPALRERREVLKRVEQFTDFSSCWPNDQLVARGLVAEIQKLRGIKDHVTQIQHEREAERREHRAAAEAHAKAVRERNSSSNRPRTSSSPCSKRQTLGCAARSWRPR
jgi:restriction system protein